jgi:hypothetical protein
VVWGVGAFGAVITNGLGQMLGCKGKVEHSGGILWLCKACGVLYPITCITLFFKAKS